METLTWRHACKLNISRQNYWIEHTGVHTPPVNIVYTCYFCLHLLFIFLCTFFGWFSQSPTQHMQFDYVFVIYVVRRHLCNSAPGNMMAYIYHLRVLFVACTCMTKACLIKELGFWLLCAVMWGLYVDYSNTTVEHTCTMWQKNLLRGIYQ